MDEALSNSSAILRKEPLVITSGDRLNKLVGLVHDEFFELDDVKYDPEQRVVHIPYRRMFHNGPKRLVRNLFVLKTYEVDVIRSFLRVYNVKEYTFEDFAKIGTYSFNTITYKDNNLRFECEPSLKLNIAVSDIEVESNDIEIKGKSRITRVLFGNSFTGQVYE